MGFHTYVKLLTDSTNSSTSSSVVAEYPSGSGMLTRTWRISVAHWSERPTDNVGNSPNTFRLTNTKFTLHHNLLLSFRIPHIGLQQTQLKIASLFKTSDQTTTTIWSKNITIKNIWTSTYINKFNKYVVLNMNKFIILLA